MTKVKQHICNNRLEQYLMFAIFTLFILLLFMCFSLVIKSTAEAGHTADEWEWRNPLPQGNPLTGVIFKSNTFWAVGNYGTIIKSGTNNYANWEVLESNTFFKLKDIASSDQGFVIVGNGGTVLTSNLDGVHWTTRNSGVSTNLNAVTWGGPTGRKRYVAVGRASDWSTIIFSTDGVAWTRYNPPTTSELMDIIWDGPSGQEKYIAVGNHGTILYATNELDWNRVNPAPTNSHLYAVAWGNNQYVALGSSNTVLTSTDGITWITTGSISGPVYDLTWNGSQFVAVHGGGNVSTSPDGITWTPRSTGINRTLSAVNWSGSRFMAVGDDGVIFSSQDGITWHPYYNSVPDKRIDFNDIACSDDDMPLYVVVGGRAALGMGGIIITSSDAINWTERSSGSDYVLNSVTRGGPGWPSSEYKFVAVGDGGTVLTSANGINNWTSRASNTSSNLRRVLWDWNSTPNIYIAVGWSGTIITSPDGLTWNTRASGTAEHLFGLAWGGLTGQEKFVAVGNNGTVLTSADGITWTAQASGINEHLHDIAWGGRFGQEKFVAVGSAGAIYISTDGNPPWTKQTTDLTTPLNSITFGGTYPYDVYFVAVGGDASNNGPILTSSNGETWSNSTITTNRLNGISYSYHGGFIAVGNYETILGPPSPRPAVPAIPFLISPTNDEVVSGNSVTFNWSHSNGATWYRLLVFEKNNPSNELYNGTVGNFTRKTVSGFPNDGTVYSWTVSANNAAGSSGNSFQRDFINGVSNPTVTSVIPNAGTQGQILAVTIRGTNLIGATAVSFGSGIRVDNYTVLSDTEIAAFILIAADAAPGARNVSVTTPVGTGTLPGGFTVETVLPTVASVDPGFGRQGQILAVTIRGTNLIGTNAISFGRGIRVDNYTVLSDTEVAAFILIAADAATGARNVSVTTPVGTGTRTGGFTVEPAATGSVQVRIVPVGARNIGAKWRLTTGPDTRWKNHNATISGLAPGIYIVRFRNVIDWKRPTYIRVRVGAGDDLVRRGRYTRR